MRPPTFAALVALYASLVTGCASSGNQQQEEGSSADGSHEAARGSDTHPDWSPDGTSVAFISNREGVRVGRAINFEVYRIAADGSGETRLTTNQEFEADLAWAPDGSRIAFKSFRDGNDEIYLMDADGREQRNLTSSPASDGGPSWSPDGATIVFHSDRGEPRGEGAVTRLYLMNADGPNVRPFPGDPGPGHSPRWSPDGRRIAFVSARDGNAEIYVVDRDGSNVRRLTNDPRENGYPRWAPDGNTIAHTVGSFETDHWVVMVIDADGGNPRQVIDDADSGNVAWSPDGTRLLFGRYLRYGDDGGEDSRLHVLDVNSGAITPFPGS